MSKGYIGYTSENSIRMSSTSGGICQLIARKVIDNRGYVSGVVFDKNFNLHRIITNSLDDLENINKSKYVQANQGNSYREIKQLLKDGKKLLFVGTPCQVAGLRSFLQKDYKELYTIDFVCLGVPSPIAWRKYKTEIEGDLKLEELDFKDKRNGWRNFTFHAKFNNGTEFNEPGRDNIYMKSVISKWNSRPCCYSCPFRSIERMSDITVADAWGVEAIASDFLDDKGTSSVMVNNVKGEELMQLISKYLKYEEVDVRNLWLGNTSAFKETQMPVERLFFFKILNLFSYKCTYRLVELLGKIYRLKRKFIHIGVKICG